MTTVSMTTGQALVRFLDNQYVSFDGVESKFVEGYATIFGHGFVLGVGQALEANPYDLKVFMGKDLILILYQKYKLLLIELIIYQQTEE